MAGTSWPVLTAGNKNRASEVEAKFDWIEGTFVPMSGGAKTNGAYDLGETGSRWNNGYINHPVVQDARFDVQATAPTHGADSGILYTKDVSAKAELHFKDEDGHEIQLTNTGGIKRNIVATSLSDNWSSTLTSWQVRTGAQVTITVRTNASILVNLSSSWYASKAATTTAFFMGVAARLNIDNSSSVRYIGRVLFQCANQTAIGGCLGGSVLLKGMSAGTHTITVQVMSLTTGVSEVFVTNSCAQTTTYSSFDYLHLIAEEI